MQSEYHLSGSFYDACNCDAICPCRRKDGVDGGRSTSGICEFILSWKIDTGHCGDVGLAGLTVCMAGTWDDDEEGTPWTVMIYIDENATAEQFEEISTLFQGKRVDKNIEFTQWVSRVLGVKRARIELDHMPGHEEVRIGSIAKFQVEHMVDFNGTLSSGITGHDFPGKESVSSLRISDGEFDWDYQERCGFSTGFEYRS